MSRVLLFVCALLLACPAFGAEVFFGYDGRVLTKERAGPSFEAPPPPAMFRRELAHPPMRPARPRTSNLAPPAVKPSSPPQTAALRVPPPIEPPPAPEAAPAVVDGGPRPAIEPEAPEIVRLAGRNTPGSIIIDAATRRLYFFLSRRDAYRYPISVGREGFQWTGVERVSYKRSWPDWHPPKEMRERDPRLPQRMTGGLKNPLGARAIYLGDTLYRIHGTNNVMTIGTAASSGCFRMRNEHVVHLERLVRVGAKVTVVDHLPPEIESSMRVMAEPGAGRQRPRRLRF